LSSIITESDISPERAKEDLHLEIKTSSGDGVEGMFEDMQGNYNVVFGFMNNKSRSALD